MASPLSLLLQPVAKMKEKKQNSKKAEKPRFKIDGITIALIVAMILIIIITINQKANQSSNDAGRIMKMISDDTSVALSVNGVIDQAGLERIQSMNYEQLKKYLNIKNDFCIYVEDENGNIILAKGSTKLSRDGIYCKE